jgi:hypothetical protein
MFAQSVFWLPFPESLSSNVVNFYSATRVYGLVGVWVTSFLKNVTKSDDDPTS